jgi:hypothetical protein
MAPSKAGDSRVAIGAGRYLRADSAGVRAQMTIRVCDRRRGRAHPGPRWHSSRSDVARCNAHDRRSRWPCRGDGYSTRRAGIGMGSTTRARRPATPGSSCARLLLMPTWGNASHHARSARLGIARTVVAARRGPAGLLGNGAHEGRRSPWRVRRWSDDRGGFLRPASRAHAVRHRRARRVALRHAPASPRAPEAAWPGRDESGRYERKGRLFTEAGGTNGDVQIRTHPRGAGFAAG